MRVTIVSADPSPFVVRDVRLLQAMGHDVRHVLASRPKHFLPLMADRFRSRPMTSLGSPSIVVFWLAGWVSGWWALLPPFLRQQMIVIIGGGEIQAATPGNRFYDPKASAWIRRSLKSCSSAIFVADHLLKAAAAARIPIPRRVHIAPTAVNHRKYTPHGRRDRQTAVLMGPMPSVERLWLKGVDRLMSLASANPDWRFEVVGISRDLISTLTPPVNVGLRDTMSEEAVIRLLQRTDVILSISRWEGMPNSLIEGMMCGCIPVVSDDVPSLPEAVGETGMVLHEDFVVPLDGIPRQRRRVRERAVRLFSVDSRSKMWDLVLREFED